MKKITLSLSLFFMILLSYGQKTNETSFEKATNYLNTRGEVCFNFKAQNKAQIEELSKIVSIGHKHIDEHELVVVAYANENTFQAFLNYNLPYTVS
ncbi:MAG: hypothetical protein WBF67_06885, partial [Olleya sp.]